MIPGAAVKTVLPAMLGRLVPLLARERLRALVARRPQPATVLPGLDTRPAPMRPLHPPAALNDNPLRDIHAAVERDLRASGYLR